MYQAAIDLAPADFRSWGRMGVSLRHIPGAETRATQAFENCIRLARDVLAVNPDDVDALKFLSLCYTRVGQNFEIGIVSCIFTMRTILVASYFGQLVF